jgi:hypothetical protein
MRIKKINNKVRVVKNKKYFNAPLDDNKKPYWIPIVVKDKSYLLGFINAYHFLSGMHGFPTTDIEIALSSDRFNDVLIDGTRIQHLSRKQLKDKIRDMFFNEKIKHPENADDILDEYYLSLSCTNCGMFYPFKTEDDVPDEDLKCNICDNTIISYVYENDDFFDFDGVTGDVDKIVDEINKEK